MSSCCGGRFWGSHAKKEEQTCFDHQADNKQVNKVMAIISLCATVPELVNTCETFGFPLAVEDMIKNLCL